MSKVIEFQAVLQSPTGKGWWHYIEVSNDVAHQLTEKARVRVICNINDVYEFQCALMPSKEHFFITVSKAVMKAAKVQKGDKLQLMLQKDESEYGILMPEVLQELLEQDEELNELFHALTKGKQRSVIHHVGKAKRVETQLKRAMKIAENLSMGIIDLRELLR